MKIEKIIKLSSGKYKIVFENNEKIITYEDILIKENILYKKEIDHDLLNKINKLNGYYNIYTKTLKYSLTKMRSEKEINKYLDKYEIEEKDKEEIIDKLKDNKIINDDLYIVSFISDRVRLSNYGPDRIKKELLDNNMDSIKIDNELSKYEDVLYEKLSKLIEKKSKTNNKYSEYIFKQKLREYFINLGYKRDMIEDIFLITEFKNNNGIKKEYEKQYNKLSKKYSGEELKYKIKNALYLKGYKIEEINEII